MNHSKRRWRPARRQTWGSQHKRLPRFTQPFAQDVVVWREDEGAHDNIGVVRSNIARTCIQHSPDGYECGYAGSGPADLALNILNAFVPPRSGKVSRWSEAERDDDPVPTYRGVASRFALAHHQRFKFEFVAVMDRQGGCIAAERIRAWIAQRREGAGTVT